MDDVVSGWCKQCLVGVMDREAHLAEVHGYTSWSSATLFLMFDPAPRGVIDGDQRII